MKIIQVVGYSNTGKTTFIQEMLKILVKQNYEISVIKHHGHEKKLVELDTGKDSWKYRDSGAIGSTVIAGNKIQMQFSKDSKWTIHDAIKFNEFLKTDLVIVEGFKGENFPKIVLVRDENGLEMLSQFDNIKAVITWMSTLDLSNCKLPIFHVNDHASFIQWFLENFMGDCHD